MDREIKIGIVCNQDDFNQVMDLRKKVFVQEMGISETQEFDGNDFGATHIYAKFNGETVACLRIRYFGDFAKFERMAVLPDFRRTTLAKEVMEYGFDFVTKKGFKTVRAGCEESLLRHWEELGFNLSEKSAPIKINQNMVIFPIQKTLDKAENSIQTHSHLAEITAQEKELIGSREYPLNKLFVPLVMGKKQLGS